MLSVMQNASQECKRLLRYAVNYNDPMPTPASRLKRARIKAGFETAKEAAEALGVPVSTYLGHENGSRGIPAKRATAYARRLKVSEQWLLYGKGTSPSEDSGATAEIARLVESLPPIKRQAALAMLRGLASAD